MRLTRIGTLQGRERQETYAVTAPNRRTPTKYAQRVKASQQSGGFLPVHSTRIVRQRRDVRLVGFS
jgi:hypothetical protein